MSASEGQLAAVAMAITRRTILAWGQGQLQSRRRVVSFKQGQNCLLKQRVTAQVFFSGTWGILSKVIWVVE